MAIRPGSLPSPGVGTLPKVHLARDYTPATVVARMRERQWERVGHGIYVPRAEGIEDPFAAARTGELARIVGVHERLHADHVFSHESAALLWGIPLWREPTTTHVTQPYAAGSARDRTITRHVGVVENPVHLHGLPVTSLEQTVVDCACSLRPHEALVIADGALRRGARREVIGALVAERPGRRGIARARALLAYADAGAESPGESATRFVLLRDGLPVPTTQISVVTAIGTFWTDLGWEEWHMLLEYDGRGKYAKFGALVLMEEKRRHDAIVEEGYRLLRVTSADVGRITSRVVRLLPRDVVAAMTPRRELAS